jgi:hypothetical protein
MAVNMGNGAIVNGNGISSRPRTPSLNQLSLTEYQTNPSPPSGSPKSKIKAVIPDEFILPTGYPDVFLTFLPIGNQPYNFTVFTTYPHIASL